MKIFCVLLLCVSSVYGCKLELCQNQVFKDCDGWNDKAACRGKATLNLANKGLTGPIPAAFHTLFGTQVDGDADNGVAKVELKKVELQGNQLTGIIRDILDCKTLKDINLQGNPLATDGDMVLATDLENLEKLNLAGTQITSLKWLGGNKAAKLKELNVANNQITDLSPLLTKTKLETLDLSGNKQIRDLSALASVASLKTIKVENTLDVDALTKQIGILTSGGKIEDKRSQLMSAAMGEIQKLAEKNDQSIQAMTGKVADDVLALKQKNTALEARLAALERSLATLNNACFAGGVGYTPPVNSPPVTAAPPIANPSVPIANPSVPVEGPGASGQLGLGGRRLEADCFQNGGQPGQPGSAVNGASALGLAATAGVVSLFV